MENSKVEPLLFPIESDGQKPVTTTEAKSQSLGLLDRCVWTCVLGRVDGYVSFSRTELLGSCLTLWGDEWIHVC